MSTRKDKNADQDATIDRLHAEIQRLQERNEQLTTELGHLSESSTSDEPAAASFFTAEYGHLWSEQFIEITVSTRHLADLHERACALCGLMDLMRRDHMAGPGSDGPGLLNPRHSGAVLSAALMLSEQMNETLIELGERVPAKAGAA